MTNATTARPVVRETAVLDRGKPLVVAVHARMIAIRPKGTREWFSVPYDALFDLARKLDARQRRVA
jgi:hypothetical protein